jgi:cytochrome c-type biogenesis protein CcmH/NrfF
MGFFIRPASVAIAPQNSRQAELWRADQPFLNQPWLLWTVGIGLELAAVVVLLAWFRRRGWLGGPTT